MAKIQNKAITAETFVEKSEKRIRIEGFNGHYKALLFHDNGESHRPVKDFELEDIKKAYPNAVITEIEE